MDAKGELDRIAAQARQDALAGVCALEDLVRSACMPYPNRRRRRSAILKDLLDCHQRTRLLVLRSVVVDG